MFMKFGGNKIEIQDEVIEFILVFSRFEYALKRHGLVKDKNDFELNWDGWLNHVKEYEQEKRFKEQESQDPELHDATAYLNQNPPRKLVLSDQGLCWEKDKTEGESYLRRLTILVKRVRNSLFHGEKPEVMLGPGKEGDFERQLNLIHHSKKIVYTFADLYLKGEVFYKYVEVIECGETNQMPN